MILDKRVIVERKTKDTPFQSWVIIYEDKRANIQPAGAEATVIAQGEFARTFIAFIGREVDVKVGDRIRVGEKSYTVRGIEEFNSIIPHKRLTLLEE